MVFMICHADGKYINAGACDSETWAEQRITFTPERNYITICTAYNVNDYFYIKDVQIEQGSTATPYEPYQSNLLTVKEEVELRGVRDVRDTLDCLTGEVVQSIKEVVLDNSQSEWFKSSSIANDGGHRYAIRLKDVILKHNANIMTNKFPQSTGGATIGFVNYTLIDDETIAAVYFTSGLSTLNEWKQWLSQNLITLHYPLKTESIKTVALNSTYYFQPVLNRSVEVNGTVLPLVYSVTVPTDPLSFMLNPNAEEGQRFIAPTFTITNDTPASIQIELKAFEQTTDTFNDVLPTKYQNWNQLSKDQSKDFALVLLPVPSEGWASLKEGPCYVADSSNYNLGEIKAESSVDFTFTASHGRAFVERLNPQYRLSFMFGF